MDIQKSTKEVMLNAISRFAKEYEVKENQCQLMIKASDSNCTPMYQILVNNKWKKNVSFNEILDLKIDFLGRELIITPFISKTLRKLKKEQEDKIDFENINVLVYKVKEEQDYPLLYFFNGVTPIKPITLDYIFGDLNI